MSFSFSPGQSYSLDVLNAVYLLLISLKSTTFHIFLESIHFRLLELPSANSAFEQEIELCEGPTRGLQDSVVGVYERQQASARPEESSKVRPIPSARIQHIQHEYVADDSDYIVGCPV